MDKLVYISYVDFGDEVNLGVMNKIKSQIQAFQQDFNTVLYSLSKKIFIKEYEFQKETVKLKKGISRKQYLSQIYIELKENPPQFMYLRYQFSDPFLAIFLRKVVKRFKTKIYIEVPTFPYKNELKQQGFKGFLKAIIDSIFVRLVFKHVHRVITYSNHDYIFGVKTVNIINGVIFDNISSINRTKSDRIRLICVSSLKPWHGYDRVIKGIHDYIKKFKTDIHFTIVGDGIEFKRLEKMVNELTLSSYVELVGPKKGDELTMLYNNSDIAISSLGLHRINLEKASTLKAREYAARGIPIVTASDEDVDIPQKYILRFDSDESPILIDRIVEYYNQIYKSGISDNEISSEIRNSAIKKSDFNYSFLPVINDMKEKNK